MLCKDIGKLSAVHQTSKVEAFHSLIIQFAPKSYVYSYTGMLCRFVFSAYTSIRLVLYQLKNCFSYLGMGVFVPC